MAAPEHFQHHHGHVHLDEADWAAAAAHAELEGEVLAAFVADTATWVDELRDPEAPPVRRVLDIGSGPGVGTCELASRFDGADVIAVDSSPAMLERAAERAAARGLGGRVTTHLAELPDGLDGLGQVDLIWASMSLHHVGDEVMALRLLGGRLEPHGLLAVAEIADPMRVLPDDLDVGRPGLADRLDAVGRTWFAAMREGLADSVPSADLPSMVTAAGLEVVGSRIARQRLDPPLADDALRLVVGHVRRLPQQLGELLDDDDLRALAILGDADDPRSVLHRPDLFVAASRQIVVGRSPAG